MQTTISGSAWLDLSSSVPEISAALGWGESQNHIRLSPSGMRSSANVSSSNMEVWQQTIKSPNVPPLQNMDKHKLASFTIRMAQAVLVARIISIWFQIGHNHHQTITTVTSIVIRPSQLQFETKVEIFRYFVGFRNSKARKKYFKLFSNVMDSCTRRPRYKKIELMTKREIFSFRRLRLN